MPSFIKGIGSFTTDNIVAILRALPETDGTYVQVVALATDNGAQLFANTIGKWLTTGRADIQAGKSQTAYARFSQRYDSIMAEHCSPDANRSRELDRAFDILERTCECGNDKMLAPDGSLADKCRECQERDRRGLQYRTVFSVTPSSSPIRSLLQPSATSRSTSISRDVSAFSSPATPVPAVALPRIQPGPTAASDTEPESRR